MSSNPPLAPGQKVELNDLRIGTVRFVGTTSFQTGEWVGVELEEASGKNDGSVQGKRYFECAAGYGIFCRASGVGKVLQDVPKRNSKTVTSNGAPGKSSRPSSIQGPSGVNGTRRQTLVRDEPGRRTSTLQGTPTPAGRVASGIRSPVKSPTKQLGTNGTSSTSTSRTGTPPTAGKRPVSGVAAKSSRPSIAPPSTIGAGRRTSTVPSGPGAAASRTSRPSTTSTAASRTGAPRLGPGAAKSRTTTTARPSLKDRLSAAREEASTGDEASERSAALSSRESAASESASQAETEDQDDEDETIHQNFAPPPVPPIPKEPDRTGKQRRPSSPGAASVHSQRTIRSTTASNRQIEELETKVRLLERKRAEDRELKQSLEKAEQERDQARGIIEKLQNKYRPQAKELEELKKERADYEKRFNEIEEIQAKHDVEMEAALVDREYAEEMAEGLQTELDALRAKTEEQALELEILRDENGELSKEMSPEERTSAGWLQLEKSNERLKEALLSLRDMTQDREAELKEEIQGLEEQVKEIEGMRTQYQDTKDQLLKSQADTEDLRQQLEVALNAEDMIERLTEDNQSLRDKISNLRAVIEDLESLRELNDELEINHIEAEKQLQEELDFKDSLLLDRERTAKEQQAALDEADYNINRFRELVSQLQSDLQDLEASKSISESEAAQLSTKSRAMMDLNQKLQTSAAKTQVKTIDLELRKLDAQQASEHLEIVQLFLPESFQAERDSVLALLRFKRIGFKANLVQGFIKERVASFGTRGQDEDVFAACDALDKLTWVAAMSDRLVNSISGCSAEAFTNFGGALYELEVVERTLNDFVDALRHDELKESDMTVRLGRSIEVMTHLSSLHLHNGLADHADDLIMRALLLQSRLDSATSALAVTRTMIETNLKPGSSGEDADDEYDESASETSRILNRLKMIVEQARNSKVVSGKTHRALFDLQARHLTLEESMVESFESTENVATQIASYACKSGANLQEIFLEEGRTEPFTPSEVIGALSRVATNVFSVAGGEAGPYDTLASRLRDLSTLLLDLSTLPTDLDNTIEFERAPAPWMARADELKATKITSVDTEAELSRTLETVRERDAMLREKEKELEEQGVRIEMLEARMKDASKRSAKIAELERGLREAKDGETKAKSELAQAQHEAQGQMDRVREEMAQLAEDRQKTGTSGASGVIGELDGNAMGASVRITIKRQEHKITALEGALRYLEEDNRRLRLPAPDAPHNLATSMSWLHDSLPSHTPAKKRAQRHAALQSEGHKILEQMLSFAARPSTVDLTTMPKNKLAWRPAKESSRWKVERRNEEWVDWKAWREELVDKASAPMARGASGKVVA